MNSFVYSSPSEVRTRDRITRRYSIDDPSRTRGHAECAILRDKNTAELSISIDGTIIMKWQCVNLVNDTKEYGCLIQPHESHENDILLTIDKSKPGKTCSIPKSDRFSEVRKISKILDSSSFRLIRNSEEINFTITGDYSLARMSECILSLVSFGLFRPKNCDFLTGVDLNDLTPGELTNLIMINITIRMVFTAFDFSPTS